MITARANQIAARHLDYRTANPLPANTKPRPLRFKLGEVIEGPLGYWWVEAVDRTRGTYTLIECDKEGDVADNAPCITERSGEFICEPRWRVHIGQPRFRDIVGPEIERWKWWLSIGAGFLIWLVVWK